MEDTGEALMRPLTLRFMGGSMPGGVVPGRRH
jgi:hypothetical protein